jgi:hypothetical protein
MAGRRGLKAELAITAVVGIIKACPKEFAEAIEQRRASAAGTDWSKAAADEFMALFRSFKTEPDFPAPTESLTKFTG